MSRLVCPPPRWTSSVGLWAILAVSFAPAHGAPVSVASDVDVASAGFFQLRWTAEGPVELQEAREPGFAAPRLIYSGSDTARVMSGKGDGDWYYRARSVRAEDAPDWGEPIRVTVRHHGLDRALTFFAIGAVVFAATLGLIVRGSRRTA